jgi:hypothetical protein
MRTHGWLLAPLLLTACTAPPPEVPARAQAALVLGDTPWAVLLCSFRNRPSASPIPVERYRQMFTPYGTGSGIDMVDFFRDTSNSRVSLSGSTVYPGPFVVDYDAEDYIWDHDTPQPDNWQPLLGGDFGPLVASCKAKAAAAGVPLQRYYGVLASFSTPIGGARGTTNTGGIAPLPGVILDSRWVQGGGAGALGHEMGHGYGLAHSGRNGSPDEYADPWDLMSYGNVYYQVLPDGVSGPQYNAQNLRRLGWLDESRVWKPTSESFDQIIQLTALYRHDYAGPLSAEIGPMESDGHRRYLVELRIKEGWDGGLPHAAVLVHRHEGARPYLMPGQNDQDDLQVGDRFESSDGEAVRVDVLAIDVVNHNATLRLRQEMARPDLAEVVPIGNALFGLAKNGTVWRNRASPEGAWDANWFRLGGATGLRQIVVGSNADGRLEIFGIDGNPGVWHAWQNTANGDWHDWAPMWGADLSQIAVAANKDGRLELVGRTKTGGVVHALQGAPSGVFGGFQPIGSAAGLQQISLLHGFGGRLTVFALDGNGSYWYSNQTAVGAATWVEWDGGIATDLQTLQVTEAASGLFEMWGISRSGRLMHKQPSLLVPTTFVAVGNSGDLRSFTVGRDADGRAEVWAIDGSRRTWHVTQTKAGSATFGDWSSDADIVSTVAAGPVVNGRVEVFGVELAIGQVWRSPQQGANGSFGAWSPIYVPPMTQLVPVIDRPVPALYGLGNDSRVWRSLQIGGEWQAWTLVAGSAGMTELAAETNRDGRLELFGAVAGGGFGHAAESVAGGPLGAWRREGSAKYAHIAVSHEQTGELAAFGVTQAGGLEYAVQAAPGGTFTPTQAIAGAAGLRELSVRPGPLGELIVAALDGKPGFWVAREHAAAAKTFDPLLPAPGPQLTKIALASDPDHMIAVFGIGPLGQLQYRAADAGSFVLVPGSPQWLSSLVVNNDADGSYQVAAVSDRTVFTVKQIAPHQIFGPWAGVFGVEVPGLALGQKSDGSLTQFRSAPHPNIFVREQAGPNAPFGPTVVIVER